MCNDEVRYAVTAWVDGLKHRGRIYDGMPLHFFRLDAEVIDYTPEACMAELFTREQADLLVVWIRKQDSDAQVEVEPRTIEDYEKLLQEPGIDVVMPTGAMAYGGPADFLDLDKQTLRDIGFRAGAFYDTNEARSHQPEPETHPRI